MAAGINNLIARLSSPAPWLASPIAVTFKDASKLSGLSESHLRFLASEKGERQLATTKVGRRRLVNRLSLEALLQS
jgi:hypothetical protein